MQHARGSHLPLITDMLEARGFGPRPERFGLRATFQFALKKAGLRPRGVKIGILITHFGLGPGAFGLRPGVYGQRLAEKKVPRNAIKFEPTPRGVPTHP